METNKLEELMTDEEFEKMKEVGFEYTWQLLDALKESARLSGQDEDEEHVSIKEYLDYLLDMKN